MKYSKTIELTVGNVFEALGKYKKASYAAGEMGVDLRSLKKFMRRNGMKEKDVAESYESAVASLSDALYDNASKFMSAAIPEAQIDKLVKAGEYAGTDDLVGDLVLMSSDIAIKGIKVRLAGTQTRINRINRFQQNYDMTGISAQMFDSAFKYSNIVTVTKRIGQTVLYIKVLEPDRVKIVRTGGVINGKPVYSVSYKLPAYVIAAVKKGLVRGIDPKWVAAAKNMGAGRGMVTFSEEEGEYVSIMNRKGIRDSMVDPEMSRSFPQIELRKLKWDGDFSVSFHIKNMIHQIIIDKSKAKSTPFKTIVAQATQAQLDKIKNLYKGDDSKALLEVTTPEVDHKYHAPEIEKYAPLSMFDNVDKVIERNFGFSRILTTGEGGSYSGGYIFTKQLIARVERWRKVVGTFWEELYQSIVPRDDGISVAFDPNALKEASQVLKEQEFALNNALASPQTVGEAMGYDDQFEVMRKRLAWEKPEDYTPVFEKSQGITGSERGVGDAEAAPGEPGSPGTDGPASNKENQTDPPRV